MSAATNYAPQSAKIVIAGGFGVGKTTFVGSVSEITPLSTEASMTSASVGIDDNSKVAAKTTTTVAMDFGRITVDSSLVLYLFGTPGQDRFGFMWDDIVQGALVAVVLVDTRRLDDCYPAVDYFEVHRIPFIVAINKFADAHDYTEIEIREALDLAGNVPMVYTDARDKESTKETLIAALEYLLSGQAAQQMHEFAPTEPEIPVQSPPVYPVSKPSSFYGRQFPESTSPGY